VVVDAVVVVLGGGLVIWGSCVGQGGFSKVGQVDSAWEEGFG